MALMAQRQFWNSLLRDSVAFVDLLVSAVQSLYMLDDYFLSNM
jgi:hypothetical protein